MSSASLAAPPGPPEIPLPPSDGATADGAPPGVVPADGVPGEPETSRATMTPAAPARAAVRPIGSPGVRLPGGPPPGPPGWNCGGADQGSPGPSSGQSPSSGNGS